MSINLSRKKRRKKDRKKEFVSDWMKQKKTNKIKHEGNKSAQQTNIAVTPWKAKYMLRVWT